MKGKYFFGLAILALVLFLGCTVKLPDEVMCTEEAMLCPDGSYVGRVAPDCNFAPCPVIVGGDKDEHGCIGSAGYSWCEEKQKCVRVWEEPCPKDNNSGELEVPKNCISWYDGCNTCGAKDGELTFCTLMYCETPAKPYCKEYASDKNIGGVGIANPASTNCVDKNGTLEIVDTNDGQMGMCTLPSGKVCEEWAYFRGECS